MQANNPPKLDLTKQHLEILEYTDTLFTRWSLRRNTYLFKHLKPSLQIPLFILAQQRRISQITQSQSTLIQALKLSQFVDISQDNRTVRLLQLPTIRLNDESNLLKIQKLVKQHIKNKAIQDKFNISKPLQYIISNKTQDGYYYLTIKQKNKKNKDLLKHLIQTHNNSSKQKLPYTSQPLYQDLKQSITKLRKSKRDNNQYQYQHGYDKYNKNSNNLESQINTPVYSRHNMMMMYPGMYYPVYGGGQQQQQQGGFGKSYGVFIRKAVESDDEDANQTQIKKQEANNTRHIKQQQQTTTKQQKSPTNPNNPNNPNTNKKYQSKQNPTTNIQPTTTTLPTNNNNKSKKQKVNQNIANKNKVVLDDNDFPSIG